jgi:hypothetical protein
MSSLIQIGQIAPQRSLLEMIQQLADQEHQMLLEARQKALRKAERSTRTRRAPLPSTKNVLWQSNEVAR